MRRVASGALPRPAAPAMRDRMPGARTLLWPAVIVTLFLALGVWLIWPSFARPDANPEPAASWDAAGSSMDVRLAAPTAQPGSGQAALVDASWAAARADETGIPVRALVGYAGAELAMAGEQPGCGIGWTTLAAIGRIESGHGTHGGSAIDHDGITRPGVFGPDLNGGDTASISDTDGGAIDGSAGSERAVGPMQFIPATWESWGADGNLDGRADPQQIDDAALAAARYLCHYGDLTNARTWREAIFAYNHLDSYVDEVAAIATAYAKAARS